MLWSLGLVAIIADLCFRQWGGDFDLTKREVQVVGEKSKSTSIGVIRIHLYLNESDLDDSTFHNAKTTISTDASMLAPLQSEIYKRSEPSELVDNGNYIVNPPFANKDPQNNAIKTLEAPSFETTMGFNNINQGSSSENKILETSTFETGINDDDINHRSLESKLLENGMGVNSMNQQNVGSKSIETPTFDAGLEDDSMNQDESKNIEAPLTPTWSRPDDMNPVLSDGEFIETQRYGEPLARGINQPNSEGGFLDTQAYGRPMAPGMNQPNSGGEFLEPQSFGGPLAPGNMNQPSNEGGFLEPQAYGQPMAPGMNQPNSEGEFFQPQAYGGQMAPGYMNQPNNEGPNFQAPSNNQNTWFNGAAPNSFEQSRGNMLRG